MAGHYQRRDLPGHCQHSEQPLEHDEGQQANRQRQAHQLLTAGGYGQRRYNNNDQAQREEAKQGARPATVGGECLQPAELVMFEHSGHCPMWEEPVRFNQVVTEFASTLG